MRLFLDELKDFWKKGDIFLLILCLIVSGFGCVFIASATSADKFGGNLKYIIIQLAATGLGVMMYALVSSIDLDFLSEHRMVISVQPAEVCKITYVVIMASVMSAHQNRISSLPSIMHMCLHLGLLVGLNMVLSGDAGVSLIFVFIFIGMAFGGGVSLWWFALAIGLIAAAFPILWQFLGEYQQNRFLILSDDTIDPTGINERYHSMMNLRSLTGGGLTGQGLFNGNRTQSGSLFAQHTDYIFSSMGEELGFVGCLAIMIMEMAIIARCIYVGMHCQDYMRRLVCYGAASALMFQVMINTGMCIGVMPVIGLTLPLISYGGSSVVTIYAMLGLVSGAHARPQSLSHERYVQPYR